MRWPWTSRARLDDLQDQVAWLREQNSELVDKLARVKRFQAGMTETPGGTRRELEPMPVELLQHINAFATQSTRRMLSGQAYRAHARGESWPSIAQRIMGGENDAETAGSPSEPVGA